MTEHYISNGFDLFPFYFIKTPCGKKKFQSIIQGKGFRIKTKQDLHEYLKTYPMPSCWLGRTLKLAVIDDDTRKDLIAKHAGILPKYHAKIASGTPGKYHYYYAKGHSLKTSSKRVIYIKEGDGQLLLEILLSPSNQDPSKPISGSGIVLPGSYNPVHNRHYRIIKIQPGGRLEYSHLEALRKAVNGSFTSLVKNDTAKGNEGEIGEHLILKAALLAETSSEKKRKQIAEDTRKRLKNSRPDFLREIDPLLLWVNNNHPIIPPPTDFDAPLSPPEAAPIPESFPNPIIKAIKTLKEEE